MIGATADQPTLDLSAAADREASDEMTTECSGSVGRHPVREMCPVWSQFKAISCFVVISFLLSHSLLKPSLDAHDGGPEDSSKSSSSSSPAEGEREERGREKTGEGASTASPATRKTGSADYTHTHTHSHTHSLTHTHTHTHTLTQFTHSHTHTLTHTHTHTHTHTYTHTLTLTHSHRWLELKAMLVRKNRKVAMKSKRRWRRFWGKADSMQ